MNWKKKKMKKLNTIYDEKINQMLKEYGKMVKEYYNQFKLNEERKNEIIKKIEDYYKNL